MINFQTKNHLVEVLGTLGPSCDTLRTLLGHPWAFFGRSWNALGSILGQFWRILGTLGTSWDALGAMLGLSCQKCVPREEGTTFEAFNLGGKIETKINKNQCLTAICHQTRFCNAFLFFHRFLLILASILPPKLRALKSDSSLSWDTFLAR